MTNNDYSINPEDLERIIGEMDSKEGLNSLITDLKEMRDHWSFGFGVEPKKLTLEYSSGSKTLFEKVKETFKKIEQRHKANTSKEKGSFRATINFLKYGFTVPATAIIEAYNQSMGLDSRKLSTDYATKAEWADRVDTLIKAINDKLLELGYEEGYQPGTVTGNLKNQKTDSSKETLLKPKTPQAHQGQ